MGLCLTSEAPLKSRLLAPASIAVWGAVLIGIALVYLFVKPSGSIALGLQAGAACAAGAIFTSFMAGGSRVSKAGAVLLWVALSAFFALAPLLVKLMS